jgi:hypothetical protein
MELLGDMGMWNLISVRLETVLDQYKIDAQFVPNIPKPQKSFWTHLMVLQGDEAHEEARFGLHGDSANLDL